MATKRNPNFFKNVKEFYKKFKEENQKKNNVNTLTKKQKKKIKKARKIYPHTMDEERALHKKLETLNKAFKNKHQQP